MVYADRAPSRPVEESAAQHQSGAATAEQNSHHRLLHDALAIGGERGGREREGNRDKDKEDDSNRRKRPILDLFKRKDKKDDGDTKPDVKKDDDKKNDPNAVKIEKVGNVESLKMPKGFTKGNVEKEDRYMEFPSAGNKDTKVCYWRPDVPLSDEGKKNINEIFKKGPHKLSEQEEFDIRDCMMPAGGRVWENGNYGKPTLRTEDIGGKRVLVADFAFKDQDKVKHAIFAPDVKNQSVEVIWFEGTKKEFDSHKKDVLDSINHIKWSDTPNTPNVNKRPGK